jgi:hypothetical protein
MYFVVDGESVDLVACAPILRPLPANLVQLEALLKPDPLQSVATVKIILKNKINIFSNNGLVAFYLEKHKMCFQFCF